MRNAKRAGAIRRAVLSAAVITCLAQRSDAQPTAPQILTEMHWSQNDQSRVLNGEFVMQDVSAITPRDLSVRMAFLVKLPPDELFRRVLAGDFIVDPQVVSSGELVGAGSLFDLAGLGLSDDAARALTGARPGPSLNLSSSKLAAFNALRARPPTLCSTSDVWANRELFLFGKNHHPTMVAGVPPDRRRV